MRLAKIQAKIYDLETLAFKTTEEVNQLVNEICELVSVRYREAKIQEKKSHNLYSVWFKNQAEIIDNKKGKKK